MAPRSGQRGPESKAAEATPSASRHPGKAPAGSKEESRLNEPYNGQEMPWRKWGPYVSERSWGGVREDYSERGTAWDFLPHDMARSKAYRWGEDGIEAIC